MDQYVRAVKEGGNPALPKILIELYLAESDELQYLRGSNNSEKTDAVGIKLEIEFDEDYREEYGKLLEDRAKIKALPAEYYRVHWYSFANTAITARSLPIGLSHIDATTIRLQSGTDYYLHNIISDGLTPKERVALSIAYRNLKEQFSNEPSIKAINQGLTQKKSAITDKDLAIALDVSQKTNWEANLIPYLDDLPFQFIGKGEQSALKIMLALERQVSDCNVILIEEPENHLSFSSMSHLISKIKDKCAGRQIIIATHSAYVLNKLGIEKVIFLHGNNTSSLTHLSPDTQNYFQKLSGYDTLRLILAKKAILVEGPSDELIVQKAYLLKHGKMPLDNGVDVLNVRGLSFSRFLDIAKELKKNVVVVTDNDGDYQTRVIAKYAQYANIPTIRICADSDNTAETLEPQIAKCNGLAVLNKIFGTAFADVATLVEYMKNNKTECALKILVTDEVIVIPKYLQDAVE